MFGVTLGSFWDHLGIILESFWDHFGIIWGSFWDQFGIILASFEGHSGVWKIPRARNSEFHNFLFDQGTNYVALRKQKQRNIKD